jgi:hypothetical protein
VYEIIYDLIMVDAGLSRAEAARPGSPKSLRWKQSTKEYSQE